MALVNLSTIKGVKQVTGCLGYWVTPHGQVFSTKQLGQTSTCRPDGKARELKTHDNADGYKHLCIRVNKKTRDVTVHALVLITFKGARPTGMVCRHLDGNTQNNHISNLAWGTHKENSEDMVKHDRTTRGERHHLTHLTNELVHNIRKQASAGKPNSILAKELGMDRTTIWQIVTRKTWKHI